MSSYCLQGIKQSLHQLPGYSFLPGCPVRYPSECMVPSQLSHHHSGHPPCWAELPPRGLMLGNLVKYPWCQVLVAGVSQ